MHATLFAHIHLDTELRASSLEGGQTAESARFLLQMVEPFELAEKKRIPNELKQALQQIQEDTFLSKETIIKLRPIYHKAKELAPSHPGIPSMAHYGTKPKPEDVKKTILKHFHEHIAYPELEKKIIALREGDSLSLDGGFNGVAGQPGHTALYRFRKQNGFIVIDVFNTGDGVTRHFNANTQPPDWYQTQASYRLKQLNYLKSILQEMAMLQIVPRLPNDTDDLEIKKAFLYTMDPLYNTLESTCTKIENQNEGDLVSKSYVGQQSGTCSFRVFTPLLQHLLPDNPTREQFRLYYKMQSIKAFYAAIKRPGSPDDWKLLTSAIGKLMRVIRKKMGTEKSAKHEASLNELMQIRKEANHALQALHQPVLPITLLSKKDKKLPESFTDYYCFGLLHKPSSTSTPEKMNSENLSKKSLEKWLSEKTSDSQIDTETFYSKFNDILAMKQLGNFEKKCAIEKLVHFLHERKIHIDTSKINRKDKLLAFYEKSESILESFKALIIKPNHYHIPTHLNTIRVASTLSTLIREATQHALNETPLLPFPSRGLYEVYQHSAGFIEKPGSNDGLKANDYRQFNIATSETEKQSFFTAIEEELLNNNDFLKIFEQESQAKSIDKKTCLKIMIYSDNVNPLDGQHYRGFKTFFRNQSIHGLYSKGGCILQKLCCFDYSFDPQLEAHYNPHEVNEPLFSWNFLSPTFSDKEKYGHQGRISRLLNRSQILTITDSKNITKHAFLFLEEISRSLSFWPTSLVLLDKTSGINTNNPPEELALNISMALEERKQIEEFFFKDDSGRSSLYFLKMAFAESGLKFYNILDYVTRHPEKLTDRYSQIIFMMGLFGAQSQDLSLLDEKNFKPIQSILTYNFKLFNKEQNPEHGVFLLELLTQFSESGFHHPWLKDKYANLLPCVLPTCLSHPILEKKALCTKIIHDIVDYKKKINPPDERMQALCNIIALNRKQQNVSPDRNYRVFSNAGTDYFNMVSNDYDLLATHKNIARSYLADALYPLMTKTERNKIAASIAFKGFPDISMTIKDKPMLFNIAKGELRQANGAVQLTALPEDYLTHAFGSEYSHHVFMKNLQKIHGASFTCESIQVQGEEHYVIARHPIGNMTFYFQKDWEKRPEVFLEMNGKDPALRKSSINRIVEPEIKSLFSYYPLCTLWVAQNEKFVVLDDTLNVIFNGTLNSPPQIYLTDRKLPHIQSCLLLEKDYSKDPKIHHITSHIEHFAGSHFRIYQTTRDAAWIDMPDYKIAFAENSQGKMAYTNDPSLELAEKQRMNFPGSMTLINSVNGKRHILIPNLPFIDAGKIGYFREYLPDYALKSYGQKDSDKLFTAYAKHKSFFQFELDDTEKPIPKTAEEKLFLCYYYLNTKQYDDAFALIQSFRQNDLVEARFPVMELLHRIICESPKIISEDDKTPFNESILAIKTQILLAAANIKVSKKISWPDIQPKDFISFTARDKVKSFFDDFPNKTCRDQIIHYIRTISQSVFPESRRIKNEELAILLGLDLAKKLEVNAKMHEWKSLNAMTSQPSTPAMMTKAKTLSNTLTKIVNNCSSFADRWQVDSHIQPITSFKDEIKTARLAILNERTEKEALLVKAKDFFSDEKQSDPFSQALSTHIQSLKNISNTRENIVTFCQELQDNNPSVQQAIESKDHEYITFEDMLVAFLRNDFAEMAKRLGVPENDPIITNIIAITQNTLKTSIALDRLLIIQEAINNYHQNPTDDHAIRFMTAITEQRSAYTLTEKNRELLIFEYHEKMRLRKNQVKSIEHVLSPGHENTCVQFIMGGGKTSVFLPLVAMKNADGDALSIVIVPETLLAVNEKQLDLKTMQLFSSKSQTIHFDRDSAVTPDDLHRILQTLEKTRRQRGYIVTSRETLQAMELKYIELLDQNTNETNTKNLDGLEKILSLFREKGKAIIDEVDSVLYIRKEFNYSNGTESPIEKELISDTLHLYRTLRNMPQEKITRENVHEQMRKLLYTLLNDTNGFLYGLTQRHPHAHIPGYLLGETVSVNFIYDLAEMEKNRLALLKHQLTSLLPSTLLQELNVTYGLSKLHPDRFAAIPYACNNVPSELSRFSSSFETLNLTIQMQLASPINPLLLEKMLEYFHARHFNESILTDSDVTKAATAFNNMTGCDLATTYRECLQRGNMEYVLSFLENNPDKAFEVKCHLLEHDIAPEITQFPEIIKSDTISFIDQLHSSMGISGTVQNHHTFHSRIQLEESLNPATDGRTLYYLLEKNGQVLTYPKDKIDATDMKKALHGMLSHPKARAIMDIGALFTGITAAEIATCLANIFKEKNNAIQHVLYYDADNRLCALPVAGGKAVVLERTDADYLQSTLGCNPDQRFTFYDQSHATGSDIRQMPDAHAIATISEKTRTRDLVQGVMRMRGFAENQTVEFLTSHSAGKLPDIGAIIQFAKKNQDEELLEDHYRAACKKMSASVRNCLMEILLTNSEDTEKHHHTRYMAFQVFKNRLLLKSADPYTQYGQIVTLENIQTVLESRMHTEIASFSASLQDFQSLLSNHELHINITLALKSLKNEMNELIKQSIPLCKEKVLSSVSTISEQVEIEVKVEQQVQQQVEELQQHAITSPHLKKEKSLDWRMGTIISPHDFVLPLEKFHPAFDGNIFITRNYGYIDNPRGQTAKELYYQRAHIFCLFTLNTRTKTLTCTLLTAKEATQFKTLESQKDMGEYACWLEMPSGEIIVSGTKPQGIEQTKPYQKILEQVQFFHGDTDLLMKHSSFAWLGTMFPNDASHFLDLILSNPLFREKKQSYNAQKEFLAEHQKELFQVRQAHGLDEAYQKKLFDIRQKRIPDYAHQKERPRPKTCLKKPIDETLPEENDAYRKGVMRVLKNPIIDKLLSLTSVYLKALDTEKKLIKEGSHGFKAIETKITLLEKLMHDLTTGSSSADKLDAFYNRLTQPETIAALEKRRYLSRGAGHLCTVFLKEMVLCFPLLLDVVTLGTAKLITGKFLTERAHASFFKVTGKHYLEEAKSSHNSAALSANRGRDRSNKSG